MTVVTSLKGYETSVTVLSGATSGEISGLAHGSISAVTDGTHGTVLDNTSLLDLYADFKFISGAYAAAPLARAWLRLYQWSSLDGGTNYELAPAAGGFNPDLIDDSHKVGDFYIPEGAGTTSFEVHIRRAPLIPGKLKFSLFNLSGQAIVTAGTAAVICYRYNILNT